MNILLAIFSTISSAFSDVLYKKALGYNINLWNNDFLWQVVPFVIFCILYIPIYFDWIPLDIYLDWQSFGMIVLALSFYTIGRYYHAMIYKREKISFLLPYENLSKVLTIVFWFLLFQDVSITTFLITLLIIGVIIGGSLDIKNLTFSKNILIFFLSHFLFAFGNLLTGYILLESNKWWMGVDGFSFLFTYLMVCTIVFIFPFFYAKWYKELENIGRPFYITRFSSGVLSWGAWLLSLVVITQLWLSVSILLSFLWLAVTLIVAYFILWDKPQKKDVIFTIFIVALVSVGFYFK